MCLLIATEEFCVLQEVDPVITGVRLSNRPLLGPNAQPTSYTTQDEAPHGILDKVKQLVGLAPADTTYEVCSLPTLQSFSAPVQA